VEKGKDSGILINKKGVIRFGEALTKGGGKKGKNRRMEKGK